VSHDERSETKKSSLHDTVPGVPEMELGRTLPTGAAYQQTAADSQPPTAARAASTSSEPANGSRQSNPPVGTGGPLTFGTTRRDFGGGAAGAPKLSAREKAKRNVLTHTLQMPLVVSPVPPKAAGVSEPKRMTIKGGSQSPAPPAGWTSMHRVGSGAPPEPTSSRPAPRSTVPMQNPQYEPAEASEPFARADASERFPRTDPSERFPRTDPSERFPRADASERFPRTDASERFPRPDPSERFARPDPSERFARAEPVTDPHREPPSRAMHDSPFAWQNPPSAHEAWSRRRLEYDRDTLPGSAPSVRVPSLSPKEWMFIGLLAIASAATLYSLLIDDVTSSIESDTEATTSVAPEHVVTPAPLPDPSDKQPNAPSPPPSAAATSGVTEIVSEPTHAEIVLGGAVIGNTPAQVVRGDKDADYLLRKPGYEPQLVRVSPHSPKSITITLHAKQF
jgi:hypothetical protein